MQMGVKSTETVVLTPNCGLSLNLCRRKSSLLNGGLPTLQHCNSVMPYLKHTWELLIEINLKP